MKVRNRRFFLLRLWSRGPTRTRRIMTFLRGKTPKGESHCCCSIMIQPIDIRVFTPGKWSPDKRGMQQNTNQGRKWESLGYCDRPRASIHPTNQHLSLVCVPPSSLVPTHVWYGTHPSFNNAQLCQNFYLGSLPLFRLLEDISVGEFPSSIRFWGPNVKDCTHTQVPSWSIGDANVSGTSDHNAG